MPAAIVDMFELSWHKSNSLMTTCQSHESERIPKTFKVLFKIASASIKKSMKSLICNGIDLNRYIAELERCPNSSQPELSQITVATLTSNSPPDPPPPALPPPPPPPLPPVFPLQVDL